MKKIPTLFVRDMTTKLVVNEINPGCEWVSEGAGRASRKWDGTCAMVADGELYKRYDAKKGKTPPPGFIPAQDPDPVTGHHPGWLKVGLGPDDKYFREALDNDRSMKGSAHVLRDGTYELVGPKVNGNPEKADKHVLLPHGLNDWIIAASCPTDYEGLKLYLEGLDIEGIVWWHDDGRKVKIKKKDFGLSRAV